MFSWFRRKNDGFEWREYVRTTIKIRREERARRIDEIRQAAAAGVEAAGRQSLSAGRSGFGALVAALAALGRRISHLLIAAIQSIARGLAALPAALTKAQGSIADGVRGRATDGPKWRLPMRLRLSANTKIAAMFTILGILAALSAALQYRQTGADWSAHLALLVAVVLIGLAMAPVLRTIAAAFPRLLSGRRIALPVPANFAPLGAKRAAGILAISLVVGGGAWAWQSGALATASSSLGAALPRLPAIGLPTLGLTAALPDMRGRARAVTGDTIQIGGRLVRLAGIEAPEISQVCRNKRNRAWRCGQRAHLALQRLAGDKTVECSAPTSGNGGRLKARCTAAGADLAQEMVAQGLAFAAGGLFNSYADRERMAQAAKLGVWQGEAQRPAEFRAALWATASKAAPDGCPIKGRIIRRAKVYVLPWALDYRQVRVRTQRGERWFCSESDAVDAGFKPSSAG